MVTPRQRKKTHRVSRKTAKNHVTKPKRLLEKTTPNFIKQNWNKELTLQENYERMGLVVSLNGQTGGDGIKGSKGKRGRNNLKESESESEVEILTSDEEVRELIMKQPKKVIKSALEIGNKVGKVKESLKIDDEVAKNVANQLSEIDKQAQDYDSLLQHEKGRHLSRNAMYNAMELYEKYGEDYEAMTKDLDLNPMQKTQGQLKRMIRDWKRIQGNLD